ncbi:hypothetical protein PCYB_001950, partial [Plasmodium cynomolgi strain B]
TYNISDKIKELKEQKNAVFNELPSYKIYDELNKKIENRSTSSKQKVKLRLFDKKIESNLKNISEIYHLKNESHNDRCLYFNYWVHDELRKIFNGKNIDDYHNETDIDKIHDVWYHISDGLMKDDFNQNYEIIKNNYTTKNKNITSKTVYDFYSSRNLHPEPEKFYSIRDFSKHKACFYNSDCTFYDCDDMKILYDYFKNYDTIENKISTENMAQCNIYQEYISYIKPIYDKYKDDCCNFGFCDYFNCNDNYDPNELLYKLKNCSEGNNANSINPARTKSEENEFYTRINKRKKRFWNSAFDENKTGYRYFRCYQKNNNTDTNMPNVASCYEVKTSSIEAFEEVFGVEKTKIMNNSNDNFSRRTISKESNTDTPPISEDTCDTLFCDTFRIGSIGVFIVGTILLFFIYYKVCVNYIV